MFKNISRAALLHDIAYHQAMSVLDLELFFVLMSRGTPVPLTLNRFDGITFCGVRCGAPAVTASCHTTLG